VAFAGPEDPGPLDRAIESLGDFDWVLFTSQNAVRFFAQRCRALGRIQGNDDWKSAAARPLLAAVGPATADVAAKQGLLVELVASQFCGQALAEELAGRVVGKKVLLPRSDHAGADLPAALRAAGAEVADVVAYRTSLPESLAPDAAEAIRGGEVDVVSFFSPSAFHNLVEAIGLETLRNLSGRVALAAIGPVTAGAIRDAGLVVEIEAREATAASLVAAMSEYFAQRLPSGVKSP
jgi:uroporphyrinogen III methyltransferase/synthase